MISRTYGQVPEFIVTHALANVTIGSPVAGDGLVMFPVFPLHEEDDPAAPADYLTLDEAIEAGAFRITEVSEGGSVPELHALNEGDQPVLLVDGDVLVGAKQNRVVNLTMMVPAKSAVAMPVSCVEAGRWFLRTDEFAPSPQVHYASGRSAKVEQVTNALRAAGEPMADQQAVWEDIAEKSARLDAQSATRDMTAMYDRFARRLDEYSRAFQSAERQLGSLFALADRIVGFDLFDHPATHRALFMKLVRSYALDAIDVEKTSAKSKRAAAPPPPQASAQTFLEAVARAQIETFPAVGEGEAVRLSAQGLAGAGLVAFGRVVHLAAFSTDGAGDGRGLRTGGTLRSGGRVRRPRRS